MALPLAHAGPRSADDSSLPLIGAPASAYGPAVRSSHGHPNADDLAGLAERQREAGHLAKALHLSTRVRGYAPDNVQAIQTEVSTLSNMGAAYRAWRLAQRHASLFSRSDLDRLRADKAAADIRDALQERRRLDNHYRYAERNKPLRAVLPELDANLAAFPRGSHAYVRTQRDRLFLLRHLGRMQQVIAAYRQLRKEQGPQPPYVTIAAADAYLKQRHPHRADRLYTRVLKAHPGADVEIFIARYYALVDGERYGQAARLLKQISRDTPVWLYGGAHGARSPNWERVDVDQLRVMDAAYRNHEAIAGKRARALYEKAPANPDLINTYATILRWRGWPERASHVTALAAAYAPRAKATRLNIADDARDMGEYDLWHATIAPLALEFPEDTTVWRSEAEWKDRSHPSMSAHAVVGESNGNNLVSGNRDREFDVRLNSPWTRNGLRAYVLQSYRWGSFVGGNASFNRVGVGGEWQWARKHAWAELSNRQLTGDHVGVKLGWSQWLNDQWQYVLLGDTYSTETPLRAERAGLRGRLLQAQVNWRQSESRSASASAGVLDISDGNLRESFSANYSQRVQASARHITRASLSLGYDHNTQPGGPYYNPSDLGSVGVTLHHDWITWRAYDQSLTQNFEATVASEWQSGFGADPGYDLQYGHTWQLSRTWSMNYAIGWGSHVYDGSREHRFYGVFGISGVL